MIDYLNAYEFTVGEEKKRYHFDEIKIPGNLDIYATMNTSDQNVYTLDTAFTRRWSKEHIPNEFNGHKIEKMYVPGMASYTWGEFVKVINGQIRDNLESLQVNEDKQVGAFFVKEKDLLENSADSTEQKAKMFAYKVLEYLWADVSKLDHQVIFNPRYTTFEDIVKDFAKGVVVFNDKLGFKTTVVPVTEAE
jgi:5-methylcytosine-specific restriction endonuclease McrBC GTP-binding regulatory subunit McrB